MGRNENSQQHLKRKNLAVCVPVPLTSAPLSLVIKVGHGTVAQGMGEKTHQVTQLPLTFLSRPLNLLATSSDVTPKSTLHVSPASFGGKLWPHFTTLVR